MSIVVNNDNIENIKKYKYDLYNYVCLLTYSDIIHHKHIEQFILPLFCNVN